MGWITVHSSELLRDPISVNTTKIKILRIGDANIAKEYYMKAAHRGPTCKM